MQNFAVYKIIDIQPINTEGKAMSEFLNAAKTVWNAEIPEAEAPEISTNLERLATCKLAYAVEIAAIAALFATLFTL